MPAWPEGWDWEDDEGQDEPDDGYCPSCGAEIWDDDDVCQECGEDLG